MKSEWAAVRCAENGEQVTKLKNTKQASAIDVRTPSALGAIHIAAYFSSNNNFVHVCALGV